MTRSVPILVKQIVVYLTTDSPIDLRPIGFNENCLNKRFNSVISCTDDIRVSLRNMVLAYN